MAQDQVKIGRTNSLKVVKRTNFGAFLDGLQHGEILLPIRYVPTGTEIGDMIDVFVYYDSEDRLIATTEKPYAMEGEFGYLEVVSNTEIGSFVDWGLTKDLLIPFREKKERLEVGKRYIVYVYIDKSGRLAGSTKIYKHMGRKKNPLRSGDEVELTICNPAPRGYNVIIDKRFVGIIYENEIFRPIREGQNVRGFIKEIRPDGKIDTELQKSGELKTDLSDTIVAYLKQHGGSSSLSDKSPPEEIYRELHTSKKAFKRAIGVLYKKRIIVIEDSGIRLV